MLFGKKSGIKNRNRDRYDRVRRLMWIKCESCGRLVYYKDYKDNKYICPRCNRAFIMTPKQRFDMFFDNKNWEKFSLPIVSDDPLKFTDRVSYKERLVDARNETGSHDAITTADGVIGGIKTTVCVLNGDFMMGSMGRAAGDGIIASIEHAIELKQPFIMVTCSGGARMQENILSLMQMARTTVAVNKLHANKIPYIVLLADPTFGGVTASFAMLGDIHIAEAGARIGFAGRRVIEQNIREKLPSNFQTADYLYEHGMADMVVKREDLKPCLEKILAVLTKQTKEPKEITVITPNADHTKKIRGMGESGAYDKVLLARNENRPHFLDYIEGIVEDWTYLAGDRLYAEDPAMCSGIGFWRGTPVVIIGQEKGRTIESRQKHRFGMPNPDGYRKAQRMMKLAEKFELPLISLFDTAGAFAGREGEERGQSQAVASSISNGLSFKAPYVCVNVGEGGSGGAIAIGTGDRVLMLENAIYSVIAPESCASILWKDNKFKAVAATAMKLTSRDMAEMGVIDEIIQEPSGGAHTDWQTTMQILSKTVEKHIKELQKIPVDELPSRRGDKFISMTRDVEIYKPDHKTSD
ncbi:MAG: acetyl-CoA carboxylase carboxyltransferase subunit alpha [Alphaproteobacteria bacterium]|nr:acetyl-CoA carboxylase carboxyltransferase subunit alpha [Alphaproteobacteria bacterium]MBN2675213.1 acetyl-CoA carboxylase carboxyltransferase subunit alpha [Alphaproteobacteria bacterium]